jgi:hypothetical protein
MALQPVQQDHWDGEKPPVVMAKKPPPLRMMHFSSHRTIFHHDALNELQVARCFAVF